MADSLQRFNRNSLTGQHHLELLAPAGDRSKMEMAIAYGADAVYVGSQHFSLRAHSKNFSLTELHSAIAYAHERSVKVYVAANILAHQQDMSGVRDLVRELKPLQPDALIISDPGVFSIARQEAPEIALHISTQASVTNGESARFWAEQGASRIILARELTLPEITSIRHDLPPHIELEAFVHGAMCMAYSGRCLLSNFLVNRGANQGECSQSCRWEYEVREVKRPDQPLLLTEDERGTYLMNSKDLCMIEHIPALVQAGLTSFKIEGRVKSSFYVATVVKAYREALDRYLKDPQNYVFDPTGLADLEKTVHRPFDTGFYFQTPHEDAKIYLEDTQVREAAVVGIVQAYLPESGLALIEQRNKIITGQSLEIVAPKGPHLDVLATGMLDLERRPIDSTPHPRMYFYLPVPQPVQQGSFVRRIGDKDQPKTTAAL
ncbi:MAG: U32 family peptidase [Eubacteriales bacterium]|nr:U32 family peptidase [Eubacteriales bacterium]